MFSSYIMKKLNLILFIPLFIFPLTLFSAELDGKKLDDQIQIAGKSLLLNGLGYRKATFLKIKAYLGGLYLEEKSQESEKILNSKQIKRMRLLFVRDVSAEKIRNTWKDFYDENCEDSCEKLKPHLIALSEYLQDVKDGSVMDYTFFPDRLEVRTDSKTKIEIKNTEFSKLVLSTWIGKKPVMESLKAQLLGLER